MRMNFIGGPYNKLGAEALLASEAPLVSEHAHPQTN